MKLLLFILWAACLFITTGANAQWTVINSGTGLDLKGVAFADSLNGFIITGTTVKGSFVNSNALLLKTSDGGYSWTPVPNIYNLAAIDFLNADTGAILGKDTVFKTVDGGNTWSVIPTLLQPGALFKMNDANHWVYVRGQHWGRTEDGGMTWIDSTRGNSGVLPIVTTDFQAIDDSTIIGVGWYGSTIFTSTNRGVTWSILSFPPIGGQLLSTCFTTPTTGFVTDGNQNIIKSTDGGINWTQLNNPPAFTIRCLRHSDQNNMYGVGIGGGIAKTVNGGNTWAIEASGTVNNLNKLIYIGHNKALAIGDSGTILMNTNILAIDKEKIANENSLLIYPNPTDGLLNIRLSSSLPYRLSIFNSIGELIIDNTVINNLHKVDLSNYSSGIYFYRLSDRKNLNEVGKIIKR